MPAPDLQKLREAAEAEFAAKRNAAQVETPEETPAEEQSYSLAEAVIADGDEPEGAPEVAAPESTKRKPWRREIDLGDGSGVQVFEANTKDELIDKLATAQANATKKIRELNRKVKEGVKADPRKPETKFEVTNLTAEEQFMLSQELQTNPTGAVAKLFKATVGATPDEIREALAEARQAAETVKAQREGAKFVSAHPEYLNTPANEKAMLEYLEKNDLAFTAKNLDIAFDELVESGLVSTKEKEAAPVVPAPTPVVRKRASVGISPRTSSADDVEPGPKEPTVEEMLRLSPEERRRIVLRSTRR